MTKQQLKEKYTEWNIEIGKLEERKTFIFHELQRLNFEHGDKNKWCSLQSNLESLIKNCDNKGITYKAFELVSESYKIEGQQEALYNLAIKTNNFKIN